MTTLAAPETAYRVTFGRVVRSEWTKLRSLRSTWITLGSIAVLTIGLAGAFGYGYGLEIDNGEVTPSAAEAIEVAFAPIDLPTLVFGVLGVVLITGEYGTGSIRATLAAVPDRLSVLGAKALVLAVVMSVAMVIVCLAAFVVGQAFIGDKGASFDDPGAVRAMFGAAANPVAYGLFGLGLGTLIRHTAGAITLFVALTLVVPGLLPLALPAAAEDAVTPYSPLAAGQALYAVGDSGGNPFEMLSPGPAAVVVLAWVAATLAAGAVVIKRRDA
jgi:ABC-2 type transport system permease protein